MNKGQNKKNTKNPQIERAAEALIALKPLVSAEDRNAAPVSKRTLDYYFGGSVKDIDTAMKLIRFFRRRIENREKQLTA